MDKRSFRLSVHAIDMLLDAGAFGIFFLKDFFMRRNKKFSDAIEIDYWRRFSELLLHIDNN